ncbi:MAG: 2-polyprenyl-3-methyl-5-hydroxy-6-metoxy-1,4-benzoquinol methylase [Ignavibacteria bacterium]|nr:2-polyprenyl-3-methyl-5-hydroxy-6-metoxy-1,4-benzoquinol methylase [Ignavibacteria bacterium]
MEEIVYHTNYELEDNYWWFVARNEILGRIIEEKTDLKQEDTALDVGCGTGGTMKYFSSRFDMLGLDMSPIALDYCRKRGLTKLYSCTFDEFPKDIPLKAITMFDVIEHIEDDRGFVKTAFDLLPVGGWLIATVPALQSLWSSHDVVHKHFRRYEQLQFNRMLEITGFRIEYSSYFNSFLLPLALIRRFTDKFFHNGNKSEAPVDAVSPLLNKIFRKIFSAEKTFLPRITFPFGLSLITVARKGKI